MRVGADTSARTPSISIRKAGPSTVLVILPMRPIAVASFFELLAVPAFAIERGVTNFVRHEPGGADRVGA